jgi:geranylgeranyl reductase family protein
METCEVAIVGGGPAGSTCAWALTRLGRDVVVLDRQAFPRDKPCAGWITPAVVEELRLDLDDYRRHGLVLQAIRGFRVGLIGGRAVTSMYDEPVSYGIRRREFDHYLLRRSGARLRLNEPLASLRRDGAAWVINDSLKARVLIGAGGHFCPVARHLGARPGAGELAVAAQEIEFLMDKPQAADCPVDAEVPELAFCPDLKGYGWCFRKQDVLNVGLGRLGGARVGEHVEAYTARLRREGRVPALLPGRFKGHAYVLRPHARREVVGDGVLLVGDAAGLAYPESGEGIRPAVESALLAARTIAEAGGRADRAALEPYHRRLRDRFGGRGPLRAWTDWLPSPLVRRAAGALLGHAGFSRRVVMERWFLHRHEAPLRPA